jgi:hypothetical protein
VGFIGCWLGTILSREPEAEAKFDELYVRSETGYGAEAAVEPEAEPEPAAPERELVGSRR